MTVSAVLYMSMSLDGFIAGPNEGPDNGLERLHDWAMPGGGGVEDVGIDISQWPLVTYVNDVTTTMIRAKEAAGDKNVLVHGVGTASLALVAGVLDEIELHVVPVLFGQGRRLFEDLAAEQIELERARILEGEDGVTHLRYRVQR
jgi:dihydrofolate reductase